MRSELSDYEDGVKSRSLELEALKSAKATLQESSGLSFLQETIRSWDALVENLFVSLLEVRHDARPEALRGGAHGSWPGPKVGGSPEPRPKALTIQLDRLVLLSRRMDSMLRSDQSADVFAKIKTMISEPPTNFH